MRAHSFSLAFFLNTALLASGSIGVAEPIVAPAPGAPATRGIAARGESAESITAEQLALHHYFYVEFPRCVQALENQIQLAEAELALIQRRVDGYRPFRSFGVYAATYTADQSWQLALLAAHYRLEGLRQDQADLWRQRQAVAAAWLVHP